MGSLRTTRVLPISGLALSLLFLPSPMHGLGARAAAQAAAEHSAEALFDEGRKLMAMKQFEEACTKFSASHRLDPAVGTLLNLGFCWKQVGKAASAWTAYREAASLAHWQRQREREAFARAEAAELETRLARLSIHVTDADRPGLELRRNGVPVPRDVWGVEVPVDPGEYTIEAVAPDHDRFSTRVSVQAASRAGVTVPALQPLPQSAAKVAAPMPSASAPPPTGPLPAPTPNAGNDHHAAPARDAENGRSILPALSLGVGAAGVVALGVTGFFALRMTAHDEAARSICPDEGGLCSDSDVMRHEQRKEDARDARSAAYVSATVGAGCLIGALVLFVATPDEPAADQARARAPVVSVGLAPGELTIIARGRL